MPPHDCLGGFKASFIGLQFDLSHSVSSMGAVYLIVRCACLDAESGIFDISLVAEPIGGSAGAGD